MSSAQQAAAAAAAPAPGVDGPAGGPPPVGETVGDAVMDGIAEQFGKFLRGDEKKKK